jgi:two-component system CheB/CheR fusion protein
VHSFTPGIRDLFSILPSDHGRPLTDLACNIDKEVLFGLLRQVQAGALTIEQRLSCEDLRRHYLLRVSALPAQDAHASNGMLLSFTDVTQLRVTEEREAAMTAEAQHRMRNLLAVVQSIAHKTWGESAARAAFDVRLVALGRVQSLLRVDGHSCIDLRSVLGMELQALAAGSERRVTMTGPHVDLPPSAVQALCLVLHELTTNAVKHGALGNESGKLDISWLLSLGPQRVLLLQWRERGVAMPPPAARGFGCDLIEQSLSYRPGGDANLIFGIDGVSCSIKLPLDA